MSTADDWFHPELVTLAAAFADDPLMVHVQPDAHRRRTAVAALCRAAIVHSARHGGVVSHEHAAAVAIWVPVDRMRIEARDALAGGIATLPLRIGLGAFRRLVRHERWTEERIDELAEPGDGYLWMLGVRPSHQGRGLSRRPVETVTAALGANRTCWLKTEQPDNVSLYEHLGFTLVESNVPPDAPTTWLFRRAT